MFNRRYRNEYEVVVNEKTGKKEVVYIGEYYRYELSEERKKQRLTTYFILLIAIVALFVAGALLNSDSSRILYVFVPYVCAIFPMMYLIMGVVRTAMEKGDMEHIAYDCSVTRIRKTTLGNMVIMGISFIGDLVYIVQAYDYVNLTKELLFAVTVLAIGGLNYYFRTLHAKYKCITVPNKKLQKDQIHN